MATEFRLPELGEGITEADVIRVLVKAGDTVAVDQPVATIETEKATVDVPSSVAGVVTQVHVQEGQTVSPGAVVLTFEEAGANASASAPAAAPAAEAAAPAAPTSEPTPTPPPPPDDAPPVSAASGPGEAAPVPAAASATEATSPPEPSPQPSPSTGEGAGIGGGGAGTATAPASTPAPVEGANPFAAPSVRMFAREIGVDINSVRGSGPAGRIDEEDVKRHARERASGGGTAATARESLELPDFTQFGAVERESLSRFRRTVARNMTASWTIPQVTLFSTADLGALEGVRRRYRDAASKAGGTLTTTALLLKIVATGLIEFPHFNSTLDEAAGELILKKYVHLGIAVDTERGLAVSVVRDVDQKDIVQLAVDMRGISDRVKANTLTIEEMRGASFTISSLETLGVEHFTPLVNWPEVAILGIGRGLDLPSYANGELSSRRHMALSLSFDHRVVDGADGARFLRWLVQAIQEPRLLEIPDSASSAEGGAAS